MLPRALGNIYLPTLGRQLPLGGSLSMLPWCVENFEPHSMHIPATVVPTINTVWPASVSLPRSMVSTAVPFGQIWRTQFGIRGVGAFPLSACERGAASATRGRSENCTSKFMMIRIIVGSFEDSCKPLGPRSRSLFVYDQLSDAICPL